MVDLYCIRFNFLHVIIRWIYFLLFLFFNYSMFQIRGIHLSFSGGLAIFFNFSHHVASLLGGYHLINLLSQTGSFLCSFPDWPAGISSFSSSLAAPAFLLRHIFISNGTIASICWVFGYYCLDLTLC